MCTTSCWRPGVRQPIFLTQTSLGSSDTKCVPFHAGVQLGVREPMSRQSAGCRMTSDNILWPDRAAPALS